MEHFLQLLMPFERTLRVTLVFSSGHVHRCTCTDLEWSKSTVTGGLVKVTMRDVRGAPDYYRISDVVLVRSRRGWRWR